MKTEAAWTTAKTAIAIGAASMLAIALAIIALLLTMRYSRSASPSIAGGWEGTLKVNGVSLRLLLKVTKSANGQYSATMDSIDQGAKDIPVTMLSYQNPAVRMELKPLNGLYQARLNRSGTEMSGQWRQMGKTVPLVFRRAGPTAPVATTLPESAFARRPGSELQGRWNGTLAVGQVRLRLVFKISEKAPGLFAGTLDSVDQGGRDIPITTISYNKPVVEIDLAALDGHFEGDMVQDGLEIDGTWTQGGKALPLRLKLSDASELAPGLPEASYVPTNEADLPGFWNGTLQVQGMRLRLALQIGRNADGAFSGTLDSIDQGAKGIPMTVIQFTNPEVRLDWTALGASYRGKLENGKLSGTFRQGPGTFPLVFERTNQPKRP